MGRGVTVRVVHFPIKILNKHSINGQKADKLFRTSTVCLYVCVSACVAVVGHLQKWVDNSCLEYHVQYAALFNHDHKKIKDFRKISSSQILNYVSKLSSEKQIQLIWTFSAAGKSLFCKVRKSNS